MQLIIIYCISYAHGVDIYETDYNLFHFLYTSKLYTLHLCGARRGSINDAEEWS